MPTELTIFIDPWSHYAFLVHLNNKKEKKKRSLQTAHTHSKVQQIKCYNLLINFPSKTVSTDWTFHYAEYPTSKFGWRHAENGRLGTKVVISLLLICSQVLPQQVKYQFPLVKKLYTQVLFQQVKYHQFPPVKKHYTQVFLQQVKY